MIVPISAGRGSQPVTCNLYFILTLLSKTVYGLYKDILYQIVRMKRLTKSTAHSKNTQITGEEFDSGDSVSSRDSSGDTTGDAANPHPQPSLIVTTKCFRSEILTQLLLSDKDKMDRLNKDVRCEHEYANCSL